MSDFFKLFFRFSIFQTILGTSVFFFVCVLALRFVSRKPTRVRPTEGRRHFLRLGRNQKPRMKSLWHPGYFQTAVIKKSATTWDEKATPVTLFCNITSEILRSDKLASPMPGEQFVFYPSNVLLPRSLSIVTFTEPFYLVFIFICLKEAKI